MRHKKIIYSLVLFILGIMIVLLTVFINLPGIVTGRVQAVLTGLLNSDALGFQIERIGFTHLHMSDIRLASGLSIDSLDVQYRLKGLSDVELKTIKFSGVTIRARLDDHNRVSIQGLNLPDLSTKKDSASSRGMPTSFLPEKLSLQHCNLIVTAFDKQFFIPLELLATFSKADHSIAVQTSIYPLGQQIRTHLQYDVSQGIQLIRIDGQAVNPAVLTSYFPSTQSFFNFSKPLDFRIESRAPTRTWQLTLSRIALGSPFDLSLEKMAATVEIPDLKSGSKSGKQIKVKAKFDLSHPRVSALAMTADAAIELEQDNRFSVRMENAKTDQILFDDTAGKIKVQSPKLVISLKGTPEKSDGNILLESGAGSIRAQKQALVFSRSSVRSDISLDFSKPEKIIEAAFTSTVKRIQASFDQGKFIFPECGLSGKMVYDAEHLPAGQLRLQASNGTLVSEPYKIKASGIKLDIPYVFSGNPGKTAGSYVIPVIAYQDQYRFGTQGRIVQTGKKAFQIKGKADFINLPKITAGYRSSLGFENGLKVDLDFSIPSFELTDADLNKFKGAAKENLVFQAMLGANGKIQILGNKMDTRLELAVNDGQMQLPDSKISVNGIQSTVILLDPVSPRSLPGQELIADTIEINKIKIKNAKMRFSLESLDSFLVENLQFNWCNGLVSSEAMRLKKKSSQYRLTLYCDRLDLTELLNQLGDFDAAGTGTLSGRIPVVYSDGNISFDNGFLFSIKDTGGKVAIENTSTFLAGVPMDSPQFSQLDLAREALKDFKYNWAKINLDTFEDNLSLRLIMDGKPSKILPFRFQKELGGFVRVDASSPGSEFEGITLDINLNLPFKDLMKFGNKIKSLLPK